MTRAQQQISLGLLVASLYTMLFMGLLPLPEKLQFEVIPYLPFWALISFGAYLLGKLGYGVLTFNDVPQAHEELMAQIQEARKDLKSKGVDVD
ncbi:dolichyl-phosphate mannosyltransferase polypeptide 3 [Sphaerulina musiva SO2202]|uniref:Dolichol-phosphate mannosyltransferase subunit 3 n=1 Tax=Sphaerulina musiva (strain SO2202) TaxID=692275 RepID=M3BVK8_SPHMS|nr:dolichyl-phosphate mannosyltransferase polypeptide 3 [Sphaerulina musiva SO2202]EMF11359.1 dolichyl-phosphate mannosyltransferase polypeptide 3 [Sphaerulina musiva SO2202]